MTFNTPAVKFLENREKHHFINGQWRAALSGETIQTFSPGDGTLLATLLLGTPTLSLMGGIGAALSVGARKGGALLALIVLPLYVPVLIFAVAAVEAAVAGLPVRPHLFLLSGLGVFALTLAPFAMAASRAMPWIIGPCATNSPARRRGLSEP
jgi:hypothetical protein